MIDVSLHSIAKMSPAMASSVKADIRAAHGEYITPKDARTIIKNRAKPAPVEMSYATMIDAHLRAVMAA